MDLKFGRNCKNANRFEAYAPSESFEFNDERAELRALSDPGDLRATNY
jgi:hypothetical protein